MKSLVLLSGGLDSSVLVAYSISEFGDGNVEAISFDYGQRHSRELDSARQIVGYYRIPHTVIDLKRAFFPLMSSSGSSLVNSNVEIPEGLYDEESMKSTVVPNRNMIMASFAVGLAEAKGIDFVSLAVHSGDHAIYPDCRPEFTLALEKITETATENRVRIFTPFVLWTKTDIVRRGHSLRVPLQLTWSCYKGGNRPCCKCGTCTERLEAFTQARVVDSTLKDVPGEILSETLLLLREKSKLTDGDLVWAQRSYSKSLQLD